MAGCSCSPARPRPDVRAAELSRTGSLRRPQAKSCIRPSPACRPFDETGDGRAASLRQLPLNSARLDRPLRVGCCPGAMKTQRPLAKSSGQPNKKRRNFATNGGSTLKPVMQACEATDRARPRLAGRAFSKRPFAPATDATEAAMRYAKAMRAFARQV